MVRIEADFALESWLFRFQPCSRQGQLTLLGLTLLGLTAPDPNRAKSWV